MAANSDRPQLYLVDRWTDGESRHRPSMAEADTWVQLDLFLTDKRDIFIYTKPCRTSFQRIHELINHCRPKHILDLRELPSLSFECVSRARFLDLLTSCGVEYHHLHNIAGERSKNHVITATLAILADDALFQSVLKPHMQRLLQHGPTIVFTDTAPESDQAARCLSKSLARADAQFSEVIVSE